jgi:Ca2+-binding RTX toxin-like protein
MARGRRPGVGGMGAIAVVRVGLIFAACVAVGLPATSVSAADGPICLGRAVTSTASPGEVVLGTTGPDVILGTRGPDEVRARDGNDLICGRRGRDVLYGGKGGDLLAGQAARDLLYGGGGSDGFLLLGDGDNVHGGGPLNDDAHYWEGGAAVTVDLGLGTGRVAGRRAIDRLAGVGGAVGTLYADVIRGNEGPDGLGGLRGNDGIEGRGGEDFLSGHRGDNQLYGGEGDDRLEGGRGHDLLNGGGGVDWCPFGEEGIDCEFLGMP